MLRNIAHETNISWLEKVFWTRSIINIQWSEFHDAEKDWRQEEKGMTEDEMIGWHHWLNEHEFEQVLGDDEVQGSLVCCTPWGCKESDMTEWLNSNNFFNLTCLLQETLAAQETVVRDIGSCAPWGVKSSWLKHHFVWITCPHTCAMTLHSDWPLICFQHSFHIREMPQSVMLPCCVFILQFSK